MQDIDLRPAKTDDADAVADYHWRCFSNTFAEQILAGELEAPDMRGVREQLEEWFRPGSGFRTRVAVTNDKPVGHVTVNGRYLVHLFVDPEHQGAGLGRRLLAVGEGMLAESGKSKLELRTRVQNLNAIAFYEREGWTLTDRVIHTEEHGISYLERILIKNL